MVRILAEQLRKTGSHAPAACLVLPDGANERAAAAGYALEAHGAPMLHGTRLRMPRDTLAGPIRSDFRIPLELRATGAAQDPVRAALIERRDLLQHRAELREIRHVAPEVVTLLRRLVHAHGVLDELFARTLR